MIGSTMYNKRQELILDFIKQSKKTNEPFKNTFNLNCTLNRSFLINLKMRLNRLIYS